MAILTKNQSDIIETLRGLMNDALMGLSNADEDSTNDDINGVDINLDIAGEAIQDAHVLFDSLNGKIQRLRAIVKGRNAGKSTQQTSTPEQSKPGGLSRRR
jgi:hypothetical protein